MSFLGFDALGRLALGQLPPAFAAAVNEDSWHQPFGTDIVRQRPPYNASRQQFASYVEAQPFLEMVSSDRWFVPLSEPVRFRRTLTTSSQQFSSFVQFRFPETISADRWAQPLTEPSRPRKPMHTGAQQFSSLVEFAPFAERVTADRWFVPLSEPVRFRRALPASEQPFTLIVEEPPFYESVTADRWFVPFSEPIRFRPKLLAANHRYEISIEFPLTTSGISLGPVFLLSTASLTGIPTSNYKKILSGNSRVIYAAEISPWTVAR